MKDQTPPRGRGWTGVIADQRQEHDRTDARQDRALTLDEIVQTFNAQIVKPSEDLVTQEQFAKAWNASRPAFDLNSLPVQRRYVGKPYARHRPTSQASAMQADRMGMMRTRVLETLRAIGPACDDRVAYELGLDSSSVRPRRIELERSGVIRENGREKTRSGRSAIRWEVL